MSDVGGRPPFRLTPHPRQVLLAKRGAPFHETSPMLYDITSVGGRYEK